MVKRILVIDDESVTRRVVAHTLKTIDIEVLQAEDGEEALEIANQETLEMAIVDINLPDIDGFTLIEHLKQIEHITHIPMIVFTARNQPGDDARALEVGAVGFLYKPFSTQELRDTVLMHLNT